MNRIIKTAIAVIKPVNGPYPTIFKPALFAALMLSLTACSSLPGYVAQADSIETSTQPATEITQVQESNAASNTPTLQPTDTNAQGSGIDRDGRVIQLGTFIEDIPSIELPENDIIELNFEQEELQAIIQQIADALQINVLIDPSIADKVSLRTSPDNPLHYADLWPLLRMMANNAGVTIEQAGNIFEFTKSSAALPVEIVMPTWLNDASSSEVLQVTPLTYLSKENAETILNPLLLPTGSIIHLGAGNLLGISGSPQQLSRVNALLAVIDDDPFQNKGIKLYELQNSDATEVAEELGTVLQLIEGEQSSYQVLGLGRINSLLVIAPATRGFDEVDRWVDVLDAESQEQVEQLFIYEVKNLTATSLASTLDSVFAQEEDSTPRSVESGPGPVTFIPQDDGSVIINTEDEGDESVSANLAVTIVADEDTNSLLVRSTPRDYRQLLTTISSLDKLPLQVLINTVIGQVTLSNSMQFGVDWTRVSANLSSGPAQLSSRVLPAGILNATTGQATTGSGLVLTQTFADGSAMINATLQAIAQENEVSLLSRPTIMAANNQEGEIKVGQAVPIDTGSSITGNGTVISNVSYRDVGIVLTITPHINADGFINLEIFQSLSAVEDSAGGVSDNPIFTNQEITTTAVVENQAMITLGGLIQEVDLNQNSGVPFLHKLPGLGALFSFQEQSFERRELFVIIRPQIIDGNQRETETMRTLRNQFTLVSALFDEAGI